MSGMMIGYIVSMTVSEILFDVDNYHRKCCNRPANLMHQSDDREVSLYRQRINRQNVKPEIFDIVHIWVDLRKAKT